MNSPLLLIGLAVLSLIKLSHGTADVFANCDSDDTLTSLGDVENKAVAAGAANQLYKTYCLKIRIPGKNAKDKNPTGISLPNFDLKDFTNAKVQLRGFGSNNPVTLREPKVDANKILLVYPNQLSEIRVYFKFHEKEMTIKLKKMFSCDGTTVLRDATQFSAPVRPVGDKLVAGAKPFECKLSFAAGTGKDNMLKLNNLDMKNPQASTTTKACSKNYVSFRNTTSNTDDKYCSVTKTTEKRFSGPSTSFQIVVVEDIANFKLNFQLYGVDETTTASPTTEEPTTTKSANQRPAAVGAPLIAIFLASLFAALF